MATRNNRSSSRNRSESSSKRNDGLAARTGRTMRDRPYASAAIAAGAASIAAGVAGLFMMKRNSGKNWTEFGSDLSTRMQDGMTGAREFMGEAMGRHRDGIDPDKSQSEIMEEAMTLKETGRTSKGSRGPLAQQDIKAGIASSNQEAKAGAKAYS